MNSLVLDLQQEVLKSDFDVLNALRKAHLIAAKLKLQKFDKWIKAELDGYTGTQDDVPEYRKIVGQLKAWNPYHGWIPMVIEDGKLAEALCSRRLGESISDIIELYKKSDKVVIINYSGEAIKILNQIRPCLKNGQCAQGRGIFSSDKAFFRRNTLCIARKNNVGWRKKTRHLGMLTFFKQGLVRHQYLQTILYMSAYTS